MIPRVFLLEPYEKQGIDISQLSEFGEIIYLFPLDGDRTSIFGEDFPAEVQDKLEAYRFDPSTDYLAVVGYMVGVVLMVAAAAQDYDALRVLVYHRRDATYTTVTLGNSNELSTRSVCED